MTFLSGLLHRARLICTRQAATLESSPRLRRAVSWGTLLAGGLLFVTLQSVLVFPALWDRSLPPEADDSLAFLVRTAKLAECFPRDCPALEDLRQQFSEPAADPEIKRQIGLASFPFPFYHPLFSVLLLAVARLTGGLISAYKVVWSLSPVFFGLGLACFLVSLWGRSAAGLALGFLAFKVLPDNGLHYLTPSNLALGLALLIWARLIRCKGEAPWTLGLGTLALVAMHPLGVVYAVISFCLVGLVAIDRVSGRMRGLMGTLLLAMVGAVLLVPLLKGVSAFNLLEEVGRGLRGGPLGPIAVVATNIGGITTEFLRLRSGLFIFPPLFFFGAALGYLTAPAARQTIVRRFMAVYFIVLMGSLLHHNMVSAPADLFFRLWIPWLAVIYGGIGYGLAYLLDQSLLFWVTFKGDSQLREGRELVKAWPLLALAIMVGFLAETISVGGGQIYATREFMRQRQALSFAASQPRLLLEQSKPGDVVVYTGYIPMAYYFLQGAMHRGARYYHPAFQYWQALDTWRANDKIRFLVAYQPWVYHPTLAGLDEKDRGLSYPLFAYAPWYKVRLYEPLGREGHLAAADWQWLAVEPQTGDLPATLRVRVNNRGRPVELHCLVLSDPDTVLPGPPVKAAVAANWHGWLEFHLPQVKGGRGYRLVLPEGPSQLLISGLTLDASHQQWPWAARAKLTGLAKDPVTGRVVFSFDPARLLPPPLQGRKAVVLDDHGDSVLLRLDPD
jgi:hypothetical protein